MSTQSTINPTTPCRHIVHLPCGGGDLYALSPAEVANRRGEFDLLVYLSSGAVPIGLPFVRDGSVSPIESATPQEIVFIIPARTTPEEGANLDSVLATIRAALRDNARVGIVDDSHGGVGTVLALLWGLDHPDDTNPIDTIRSMVCDQLVETWAQAQFAMTYLALDDSPLDRNAFWPPTPSVGLLSKLSSEDLALDESLRLLVEPEYYIHRDNRDVGPYIVEAFQVVPVVSVGGTWWVRYLCRKCTSALAATDPTTMTCTFCHDQTAKREVSMI